MNYPKKVIEMINEAETNFTTGRLVNAGNLFHHAAQVMSNGDLQLDAIYFLYRAANAYQQGDDLPKLARTLTQISNIGSSSAFKINREIIDHAEDIQTIEQAMYNTIQYCLKMRDFEQVEALTLTLVEIQEKIVVEKMDLEKRLFYLERQIELFQLIFNDEMIKKVAASFITTIMELDIDSLLENELEHYTVVNHLLRAARLAYDISDDRLNDLIQKVLRFPYDIIPFEKYDFPQIKSIDELRVIDQPYTPGDSYVVDLRGMVMSGSATINAVKDLLDKLEGEIFVIVDEASISMFDQPYYFDPGLEHNQKIIRVNTVNYQKYVDKLVLEKQAILVTHDSLLPNIDNKFYTDTVRTYTIIDNEAVIV